MKLTEVTALIYRQAHAWENADYDAILADFAPDALFISPGGRYHGQAAIRAAVVHFFAAAHSVQVTIHRVLLDGHQGAVEWHWSEVRYADNARHAAEDGIIFEVDAAGKIRYWREYFDTANF
jgi:uncharacterized protein (TIGR02246 family)